MGKEEPTLQYGCFDSTEYWNYTNDWQSAGSLLQKLGLRLDKLSFTYFCFLFFLVEMFAVVIENFIKT